MPLYELGQTIVWELQTRDAAGALADVGGGNPAATVTRPDGTTESGSVAKASTGTYTASVAASQLGRWVCKWTGSGANSAGLPFTDHGDVLDPARMIVPLGDAREALNTPAAVVVNDSEIRRHILSTADLIENEIGPVLPRTIIETHVLPVAREAIALHNSAATITGATVDGVAVTSGDWLLESGSVLHRGSSGGGVWWGTVVVTYTVGASALPASLIDAARIIVQLRYQQEQQRQRPALGVPDDAPGVPLGFVMPNAARSLLQAAARQMAAPDVPGFA